jgi:predicted SnoaL-like aldol condensation-catalyzing enzyme
VLTEETQQGAWFLEELGRKHPGALYAYHQEWVECLARAAETEAAKAKWLTSSNFSRDRGDDTMATSDIDKVLAMFRGIANRDPDLATKLVKPVGFKQHNPHVADGVEGLRKHNGRFPEENHHLKVVRKLQDGPFVFTHRVGLLLHQGVFFDIFKFGDGLIVEHWMFSTKGAPPNESGHTQTDGPTEAKDLEHTEKNKSLVRDY